MHPRAVTAVAAKFGSACHVLQGIGAKTAKQLVQSFGTVEQIAQQLAALSEEEQKQVGSTRLMQ